MTCQCPYCGNTEGEQGFSAPVPLCDGMPADLGIPVPMIRQCLSCKATLSPEAFQPTTKRYAFALAAKPPSQIIAGVQTE